MKNIIIKKDGPYSVQGGVLTSGDVNAYRILIDMGTDASAMTAMAICQENGEFSADYSADGTKISVVLANSMYKNEGYITVRLAISEGDSVLTAKEIIFRVVTPNNADTIADTQSGTISNILTSVQQSKTAAETSLDVSNQALAIAKSKADSDSVYTKTEIDSKISSVYRYKGSVDTYENLPVNPEVGDVYNIKTNFDIRHINAGDNVAWTGSEWDVLSGTVDLSGYATKTQVSELATNLVGHKTEGGGEIFNNYESNVASAKYSRAEGDRTEALAIASHAEGQYSVAAATGSHAGGWLSRTSGNYSFAHGVDVRTYAIGGAVFGKYNIYNGADNRRLLFVIGNGEDDTHRHNALTVDIDGNTVVSGDLTAPNIYTKTEVDSKLLEVKESAEESLDSAYEELKGQIDTNKEEAETKHNKFEQDIKRLSNALKGNVSGNPIFIDDVSEIPHDVNVSLESKNLFTLGEKVPATQNGVTISKEVDENNNEYYVINGTCTGSFMFAHKIGYLPSGSYVLSANNPTKVDINNGYALVQIYSSSANVVYETLDNEINGVRVIDDLREASDYYCRIRIQQGVTYNNFIIKPQLEKGTAPTPYTPYVDVSGVSVTKYGKNLYKPTLSTQTTNGITATRNEDNSYTVKGTATANTYIHIGSISVPRGYEYYVSGGTTNVNLGYQLKDGNTQYNTVTNKGGVSTVTNTHNGYSCDSINVVITVSEGITVNNVVVKPMISFNSNSIYEPYIEPVTYVPGTDGTAEGVTAIYPTTTLIADDRVVIDVEYNKDINKAFAELQQAIISLGGNV